MLANRAFPTKTEYYFENNGRVVGPLSLHDIKEKKLLLTTLVWRHGLDNWTPALEMEELKSIFHQSPPPLPTAPKKTSEKLLKKVTELKKPVTQEAPQYDEKYRKETEATTAGIFLLITPVLFLLFYQRSFMRGEDFSYINIFTLIMAMVIRTIATTWVMYIARHQNREAAGWCFAALVFPAITLMIIGQKKKLYDPAEWKQYLYNETRKKQNALFHAIISEKL